MFRFTIRDVLWLTVVVALGVGWWLEFRQFSPQERATMRELRQFRTEMRDFGPTLR